MCIPLVLLVILVDTLVAAFGTDAPTTLSSPIRQRRLLESVSSEVVVINMDWSPVEKKTHGALPRVTLPSAYSAQLPICPSNIRPRDLDYIYRPPSFSSALSTTTSVYQHINCSLPHSHPLVLGFGLK